MGMAKELKEFTVKGHLIDMAVGIIIGAAFGKIVSSFFAGVIMPPIGVMLGGVEFSNLAYTIQEAVVNASTVAVGYGKFIQISIAFLIIAFAIFIAVKFINSLKREEEEAPKALPSPSKEDVLQTDIRDLIKERQ